MDKVTRRKSDNQVPIVAVSSEPRVPDDFSKASGERLYFPDVQALGDRSHKVP